MALTTEQFTGLGNQQSNAERLTFLAGLITGEGCFTIGVSRLRAQANDKWARLTPIFSLSMIDERTMLSVADDLKSLGLPVYYRETKAVSRAGRAPLYNIHITGLGRVSKYAEVFAPHLRGNKQEAAEVILRFCRRRLARHHRGIDEADIFDIEEIRRINSRNGGNKHSIADLRDYTERRGKTPRKI